MPDSPHHQLPPGAAKKSAPVTLDVAAEPAPPDGLRGWSPATWALTLLVLSATAVHTLGAGARESFRARTGGHWLERDRRDAGSPTVETIGWVSFALVIVVVLGTILRAKLTTFAQSLPTDLDW